MSSLTEERYARYVMGNYGQAPLTLVKGEGCRVWDEQGRGYLDFTSGIAVTALGHGHPALVKAIREQAAGLGHVSNLFRHPGQGLLAEKLVAQAGPGRVLFVNSGAEANEALIKLARLYGQRKAGGEGRIFHIVAAENAFHGRTFGGMSATPQAKIQKGFAPLVPGFSFARLNDEASFRDAVTPETAAIFVETIQGEGGINPCSVEFLLFLRKLCDEKGILLLLDEVQCGIGRTGDFFAFTPSGIRPDAIGMAKGLGGGVPIGAVWVDEAYADLFTPGSHGTTFGGTPLVCAAALAVLETLEKENLLQRVREQSARVMHRLMALQKAYPGVLREIRGRGYMIGLALHQDPLPLWKTLREQGLLVPMAGGQVIRLLPPLIAAGAEWEEALAILEKGLQSIASA